MRLHSIRRSPPVFAEMFLNLFSTEHDQNTRSPSTQWFYIFVTNIWVFNYVSRPLYNRLYFTRNGIFGDWCLLSLWNVMLKRFYPVLFDVIAPPPPDHPVAGKRQRALGNPILNTISVTEIKSASQVQCFAKAIVFSVQKAIVGLYYYGFRYWQNRQHIVEENRLRRIPKQ